MMGLAGSLRQVPAARLAQEAVFGSCMALGWPVEWAPLPAYTGLLRFRQVGALGEVTSLVQTADWAEQHWPSLPGLAWGALDSRSAHALFAASPAGPVPAPLLQDGQTQWQGLVQAQAEPALTPLPCLRTAAGPVWIESLTVDTAWRTGGALPPQVPLHVQYRLTRLTLLTTQVRRLGGGDTVIMSQMDPVAVVSGRPLFSFSFNEGHMIITEFDDLHFLGDQPPAAAEAAAPAAPLNLAAVPVTVDVVLCHMVLTVGELAQFHPGKSLSLADNVHRQVELRVNGQLLARGELVQVGEHLGVQIEALVGTS